MLLRVGNDVIADRFFIAAAPRNAGQLLKIGKYALRLQSTQYIRAHKYLLLPAITPAGEQ